MAGRKKQYSSPADRQKAYRERQKPQIVTLRNCPACGSDALHDVTGELPSIDFGGLHGGKTYICMGCWKAISAIPNLAPKVFEVQVHITPIGQFYHRQGKHTDD